MILSLIQKRRSIRKFQPKVIEPAKVEMLLESALRAPSSRGLNPWEFVVMNDASLLEKLAESKQHGSSFLKRATLAIVICADPKRCDVWIEDAAIAATYIQLAAESLGLGSCWIQIRERMHDKAKTSETYVREVLEIPEHVKIEAIIAIGYPDEKLEPHSKESLRWGKIYYNRYGGR